MQVAPSKMSKSRLTRNLTRCASVVWMSRTNHISANRPFKRLWGRRAPRKLSYAYIHAVRSDSSRRRRPLARSTPRAGTDPCWCWPTCRALMARRSRFAGSIQLEDGDEIGRAGANFDGPIVFCVISRYRGGAFVVFSNALNENMQVLAVEGSFSSFIGGPPPVAGYF